MRVRQSTIVDMLGQEGGSTNQNGTAGQGLGGDTLVVTRGGILFARDVMAVCGIRYGAVRSRTRTGFGVTRELHSINLDARDVPDWFFVIGHHRLRVEGRPTAEGRTLDWVVESVEKCGAGEVFGAVVPGARAVGLADGLLTGALGQQPTAATARPSSSPS